MIDPDELPWTETRYPGVALHVLHEDAKGGAAVLIRMAPGAAYPRHEHPAGEEVLVLQGLFEDERGRYPEGSFVHFPPGSRHGPRCPAAAAQDCVLYARVPEAIRLLDRGPQS